MKHLKNRRIRRIATRLYVKARRTLRKENFSVIALTPALAVGFGLTLTVSAVSILEDDAITDPQIVATAQVDTPDGSYYETLPDGAMFVTLSERLETQSSMLANALETTSSITQASTTAETTATTTTFTEETQFETVAETETESENEYEYEYEYDSESEATEPVAWEETAEEETDSGFETEAIEGSVYDYVSEDEIIMLAKTVAQEGGDCSYAQQACVIWTVLNRVDSLEWPNTISENLTMSGQFAYYPGKSYRDDHYQVAYDQVYNWLFDGERYLSSDYQYFYGDGWRNHFYGKNSGEYVPA